MTEEQLQAIRARVEAATPGPWHEWHIGKAPSGIICDTQENGVAQVFDRQDESYRNCRANAFFIAHACNDVPALLAEVDTLRRWTVALQAELDQVRQERDRARQALHVRDLEATGLYDCYGQPIK